MKKKKLPSIAKLRRKLDKVFSEYIRERDKYTCFTCGRTGKKHMQAGHGLAKRMNGTLLRYHPMNVQCQCFVCNRYQEGNGLIFAKNLERKFGSNAVNILIDMIPRSKKFVADRQWYEVQIELYTEALDLEKTSNRMKYDDRI